MEFFLKDISLLATLKFEVKQKFVFVYMYHQATRASVELKFSLMGETKMRA